MRIKNQSHKKQAFLREKAHDNYICGKAGYGTNNYKRERNCHAVSSISTNSIKFTNTDNRGI